jgi:Secretion system C-terminal sorting domain
LATSVKSELAPASGILSISPNPSNDAAFIRISSKGAETLTLTLHNILGQEIMRLVRQVPSAGEHEIALDTSTLPQGVYQCCVGTISAWKSVRLLVQR